MVMTGAVGVEANDDDTGLVAERVADMEDEDERRPLSW